MVSPAVTRMPALEDFLIVDSNVRLATWVTISQPSSSRGIRSWQS